MVHRELVERGVPVFLALVLGLSACRRGHAVVVEVAPEPAPSEEESLGPPEPSAPPTGRSAIADLPPFSRLRSTGLEKITLLIGERPSVLVSCSDGVTSHVSVAVREGELVLEKKAGRQPVTCEARVTSGNLITVHTDGSLVMRGEPGQGSGRASVIVVGGKATVTQTEPSEGP